MMMAVGSAKKAGAFKREHYHCRLNIYAKRACIKYSTDYKYYGIREKANPHIWRGHFYGEWKGCGRWIMTKALFKQLGDDLVPVRGG